LAFSLLTLTPLALLCLACLELLAVIVQQQHHRDTQGRACEVQYVELEPYGTARKQEHTYIWRWYSNRWRSSSAGSMPAG